MGRKDKLRREKEARKRKKENAAPVTTPATTTQAPPAVAAMLTLDDDKFPKSDFYVQAQLIQGGNNVVSDEIMGKFMRGAKEYGCIHSMTAIGRHHTQSHLNGRQIILGQPWILEGSIRGSLNCAHNLLTQIYGKAQRCTSLISYWMKILTKHHEWSDDTDTADAESTRKILEGHVVKQCTICFKQDTETLTLRQCSGCSTYCYCSKECQTKHWNEQGHGGECRQLKILNKYHKPYAKEIQKAAIRGESHPALEKLRNKLGLTRPLEEYQELRDTNTYEGKQIDPYKYVVARKDGTVWIGSTPMNPMGRLPSDTTTFVSTKDEQSSTL